MRPETGPIKFGGDWTGTFIRGDDAFAYAMYLEILLDAVAHGVPDLAGMERVILADFVKLLRSSNEQDGDKRFRQELLPFDQCVKVSESG